MRISDWSSDVCSSDLDWVGLADRSAARPATLSGGEQQRVAIARAVIGRPDLLVADEPTGNVDQDMAFRLMHLFDELNRLGTTVLVATHDEQLMSRVPAARMMRLERGLLTGIAGSPPATAQTFACCRASKSEEHTSALP